MFLLSWGKLLFLAAHITILMEAILPPLGTDRGTSWASRLFPLPLPCFCFHISYLLKPSILWLSVLYRWIKGASIQGEATFCMARLLSQQCPWAKQIHWKAKEGEGGSFAFLEGSVHNSRRWNLPSNMSADLGTYKNPTIGPFYYLKLT